MRSDNRTALVSTRRLWAGRVLSGSAVLFLLFDSVIKLMTIAPVVGSFGQLGYPVSLAVVIGTIELLCLIVYVVPRSSILGAILLTGYLGGAVATHLRIGSPLFTHILFPIYIAALLWGGGFSCGTTGCAYSLPHEARVLLYLLAIGSAVLYGAADFTGGLTTRRAGAIPVVILSQASGLILLALILPLLPAAAPSRSDLLWGAVAGLTGGIGVALLYRALAIGTMAVVAPTTAVCAVAIPVVISLLLGERPVPLALAGIALGIVSIILVSQQQTAAQPELADTLAPRPHPPRSGVGTALASGVAIGFFLLSLAQTKFDAGMWPLLVARLVSVTLFGAIALALRQSVLMPARLAGLAIVCGGVDMLANALYLLAARVGPLSIVVTLSSLYPASTVLLARVVLGERLSLWQITGVGCALAAVVLIVSG